MWHTPLSLLLQRPTNTDSFSKDNTAADVEKYLRSFRKDKALVSIDVVRTIAGLLDQDDDICGRLDADYFSTILQIILQTEFCRESERTLYLLAVRNTLWKLYRN